MKFTDNGETYRKIDEYELENREQEKIIYPFLTFKFICALISIICIVLEVLKGLNKAIFITKHVDWVFVNVPIVLTILIFIIFRHCQFDQWLVHIAQQEIGATWMKPYKKKIVFNFDVRTNRKDVLKFIQTITDRSELYNYFLLKADYTAQRVIIKVKKKLIIPKKALFTKEIDDSEKWNFIPLGITLTDSSELGTINWMLNDQEKIDYPHKESIPSTSLLISGGTGSGKSVLENNIIRHINKYSDKMQSILVDVKRVEFGNLGNLKGVSAVATDLTEAASSLSSARNIMYQRFKFMENNNVNNIYKIKDFVCDYYTLDLSEQKEEMQFDTIVYSLIDGDIVIDTINNIYDKYSQGSEVLLYLEGRKEPPIVLGNDHKVLIDGKIYNFDDTFNTKNKGALKAIDVYNALQNGEVIEV